MISVWREAGQSNFDFHQANLPLSYGELIDLASYPKACFGVVRSEAGQKSGLIISHFWTPNTAAWDNYSYQYVAEGDWAPYATSAGLYAGRAPSRILKQLDDPQALLLHKHDKQRATEWRKACREWNTQQSAKVKPKKGQLVVFEKPYVFRDGSRGDTFIYQGGALFKLWGGKDNCLWQLRGWRQKPFSVEDIPEAPELGALGELLG